jgi:hypothetical protein
MEINEKGVNSRRNHLEQYIARPLPHQSEKQSVIKANKSFLTVFETGTGVTQAYITADDTCMAMMVQRQRVWVYKRYEGRCGQE